MSLIFIDFEVFKHDWLVVMVDPNKREETAIVNDSDKLKKFYSDHKNDIFIGYNIRQYDQFIFKAIILDFDPKKVNDHIIMKNKPGWRYTSLFSKLNINIYDVMTTYNGLKTIEGFLGNNIKESGVDFNLERKLTPKEISDTIDYCRNDVYETMKIFLYRKDEYDAHVSLINTFNLPINLISKTKVQLSAKILGAVKANHDDEFDIEYPHSMILNKYHYIKEWYDNNRDYDKSLEVDIAGVPHIFAWGGLHGARNNYISSGEFLNVDVASYYPSLMIEYGWESRNCVYPEKYKEIYRKRLELKAAGKKKEQAPYKIVLNGTYGAMKDKYNPLYDPRQANNVCVGGQLLLLDLIEKLENHCDIIQSNTDGILIKLRGNRDKVESICNEWEDRTMMKLEYDEFVKVIQKDVNNYIIVDKNGKYKSKGAYVKKLDNLDYNLPIVNEALIDYFVRDIPIEQTINQCNDLIKFQQIFKVTSNYDYAVHGYNQLTEKTLRVFASKEINDPCVYKVKNRKYEKFADSPLNCMIINGDIKGLKCPDKLDKQYYIEMAKKRMKGFTGDVYTF